MSQLKAATYSITYTNCLIHFIVVVNLYRYFTLCLAAEIYTKWTVSKQARLNTIESAVIEPEPVSSQIT